MRDRAAPALAPPLEGEAALRTDNAPLAARGNPPRVTLFACATCRASGADGSAPPQGSALAARLAEALEAQASQGVALVETTCLANCRRGSSLAMARAGGFTYVFGDLTPDDAGDILEGAHLLAAAEDGLMPWRGRPDCLKRGMIARIPPLPPSKDIP